jgi:hypothetical protein
MITYDLTQDPSIDSSFCRPFLSLIIFSFHFWYHNHYSFNYNCNTWPQLSTLILPRVPPWGWPEGLAHNLQVPQQVFNKKQDFCIQDAFQASECYSPTSSQARVLVVQASVAAYLQDLPSRCFSYDLLHARKRRNHYWRALYKDNFLRVLNQEFPFFCSRVAGFASNPSSLKCWLLRPFFYVEAICKGSTRKGLPYAAKAVPAKDYFTHLTLIIARKGRWVINPNYRAFHPRRFCAVRDVVAQRYDILRDWLWDACHMAGVQWGSHCEAFVARKARTIAMSKAPGSCHKTSNNEPYSWVWKSLGDSIPKLYCLAWLGLGHARKCQFKDFWEKERYDLRSVQRRFSPETFGKSRKSENSPVVRLLQGFHKHLASRNPRVLCQKHGGACTMY